MPHPQAPTRRRLCGLLAAALLRPGPAAASPEYLPEAEPQPQPFPMASLAATLTLPPGIRPPVAAVAVLHDRLGPDPRAEPYIRHLLGAGLAAFEILDVAEPGEALAASLAALAADPRVDARRVGALGFGGGAAAALAPGLPLAARALLYPGCEALARLPDGAWPGQPILLLHGGADPANRVADCRGAAAALARAGAAVRRIEYRDASYAWDHPGFGLESRLLHPAPDGEGRVEVLPWPGLATISAGHVAGFFARELALPGGRGFTPD